MKQSMRSRLEQLSQRLIEVDALLAEPEIANDMDRFRKLSRERAEIDPVVELFKSYESTEADLETAMEMMSDPELKEMGEEEMKAAKDRIAELEEALQLELLPKDPDDGRGAVLKAPFSHETCSGWTVALPKKKAGKWKSCPRTLRKWVGTVRLLPGLMVMGFMDA